MFYVIRVKGWPALVWLEVRPSAGRCQILGSFDDVLQATAVFCAAVEWARARMVPRPSAGPGAACWTAAPAYDAASPNTMSPSPPLAKKRPTYDSAT
jgi:hypothetical protein